MTGREWFGLFVAPILVIVGFAAAILLAWLLGL